MRLLILLVHNTNIRFSFPKFLRLRGAVIIVLCKVFFNDSPSNQIYRATIFTISCINLCENIIYKTRAIKPLNKNGAKEE